MDTGVQVYGLGQCCVDFLGRIEAYPPPDSKCEFSGMVVQGGGPVATALVALTRWGMSCAIAGVVGDDRFGSLIRQSLEREGIDIGGLRVRQGGESQFSFIVAEPGVGRRTIFWRRPTGAPPLPGEIDFERLRKAQVFYTDGLFPEATLAAARTAKQAGVPIVVDAGSLREGVLELAAMSDHFITGEPFAKSYAGDTEPLEVCRRVAELGPSVVGVTLGARGYVALADGVEIERPAYPVEAVDTTGCGDIFHAGYTYGLLRGWSVEKRLDFAAWAASRVALRLGGRTAIPAPEEWNGFAL
jgi:ribokinase